MLSPYTGKEMKIVYEVRTWNYRGEDYEYVHTSYKCEDSGEQFTTCESDDAGFLQVTNQYRVNYGIPFTDEIIEIRQKYGLSATKMSAILGIGVNQWRLYENGEVPSVSNGRIIRSIMNPRVFLDLVDSTRNHLSDKEYNTIREKVIKVINQNLDVKINKYECQQVFSSARCADNGFAIISLKRLKNILFAILNECGEVFYTKMNKLLFYVDFLSYRQRGVAMTGLTYRAIEYGPVPEKWARVYSEFNEICHETRRKGEWEGVVLSTNAVADESTLSEEERDIIRTVCNRFKEMTASEISAISHKEEAWSKYHNQDSRIPFTESFSLKAL